MKTILFTFIFLALMAFESKADIPSTHGMVLFGDHQLYASHLPMFHAPHDYQLVTKISIIPWQTRVDVFKQYQQHKAEGETLFTLVPEKMDLTLVINGQKNQFVATVFAGHFEQGGTPIGTVKVTVTQVIFTKKLNPKEAQTKPEYFKFGNKDETYAVHIIKGKPSFDEILKLKEPFRIEDVEETIYSDDADLSH
jgi:hypothetical protein